MVTPTIDGTEYPTSFSVEVPGQYGLLFVNGDNLSTSEIKEGGVNGETVIFKAQIGEIQYELIPSGTWNSGTNQELNLSNPSEIPVELSSFIATSQKNSVTLYWTTESESNNFGFEIQRSGDNFNFSKIVFIHGQGTTASPHSYKYTDASLPVAKYYYRLKQIDFDGTSNFSQVAEVTISNPSKYLLLQNYPNPFNPNTTITFEIPIGSDVTLSVYDINGRLVRTLFKGFKPAGIHSFFWDGKNEEGTTVSNGVYLYSIKVDQYLKTKKMMLVK